MLPLTGFLFYLVVTTAFSLLLIVTAEKLPDFQGSALRCLPVAVAASRN